MMKGQRSKRQILNSLRWPIYVINSVDNTKLPCYTLPPTQHHSFFRNLPPEFRRSSGEAQVTGEESVVKDARPPTKCLPQYSPCFSNRSDNYMLPLKNHKENLV